MDKLRTLATASLVLASLATSVPVALAVEPTEHEHRQDIHHDRRDIRHDRREVKADHKDIQKERADLRKDHETLRQDQITLRNDLKNGASADQIAKDRKAIR